MAAEGVIEARRAREANAAAAAGGGRRVQGLAWRVGEWL